MESLHDGDVNCGDLDLNSIKQAIGYDHKDHKTEKRMRISMMEMINMKRMNRVLMIRYLQLQESNLKCCVN